jgi:galactokinase
VVGPKTELEAKFRARYPESGAPRFFRAPGRINLIGDHTDYTGGLVMPMAIESACYVGVAENGRDLIRMFSEDAQDGITIRLEDLGSAHPRRNWTDYVIGVAVEIQRAGRVLRGQDLLIQSTIPIGAGLSSSAALEVSSALALLGTSRMEPLELVLMCQRAENKFVGVPCGVMDQFTSVFGRSSVAIKLDCRTLEYEPVPLPRNIAIVAVNSMVKHDLGSSVYRQRVEECRAALQTIQAKYPAVASLRDVTADMLAQSLTGVQSKRARHVVSENMRVVAFAGACRAGNTQSMGVYLTQSHRSLQQDFEVSCPELDFLVETAMGQNGCLGARMTGGGSGGCTVNLLTREAEPDFRTRMREAYQYSFGVDPQVLLCEPGNGASMLA